jgi:drug/metabolite transporter (DMT)-like permease
MSRRRKIGLISTSAGLALAVAGLQAAAMRASLAQTAMLLLAITAAAAFALSFLCLERPLTLVLLLSTAVIAGLALSSERQQAVRDWRYVWLLELLGLTIGVVGFTLAYLRDDESQPGRSITA